MNRMVIAFYDKDGKLIQTNNFDPQNDLVPQNNITIPDDAKYYFIFEINLPYINECPILTPM
jgi:hypothetical protein